MNVQPSQVDPPANLLRNHRFLCLWCAYAVSAMGDHLSEMAILKTQNALNPEVDITPLTARMMFSFFLPFAVLAPLAGVLADRLPRSAVMITADLARAGIMVGFAALIAATQHWGDWGPFLPLLPVGMFAAFFSPARSALLPTLIRPNQLVRANALISGLGIIATMAAAKIGGFLADRYAPTVAFNVNACTFLLSAMFVFLIGSSRQPAPCHEVADGPAFADLRAGFRYARAHRHVWELLLLAALIWFCAPLVNSVIPAVVRDVYQGTYSDISGYRAKLGAGFVLGAVVLFTLGEALRSQVALTWGFIVAGFFLFIFASSTFLDVSPPSRRWLGTVGVVGAGIGAQMVMASLYSLLQRTVADRFRGRIFGAKDIATTFALLLSTGLLGIPDWPRMDQWVGYILLGVSVLTLSCGLLAGYIRLGRSPLKRTLQFGVNLTDFLTRGWWRFERTSRSPVPISGPVIVTANHRCPLDPFFLSAASFHRPLAFMVAREYQRWFILRWVDRWCVPCIPVNRDGHDAAAFKAALRLLRGGGAIGIFIEGGIVAPGQTPQPRDGVAMLALRTGATVIPAYISGTRYFDGMIRSLLTRHRARVRWGSAVDLSQFAALGGDREAIRAATTKIYDAISQLRPEGSSA